MKQVKVSELKAHLSAYLAQVRAGETVVVCYRSTPIARLEPILKPGARLKITPATRPPSRLEDFEPVTPEFEVDVVALLREDRDRR